MGRIGWKAARERWERHTEMEEIVFSIQHFGHLWVFFLILLTQVVSHTADVGEKRLQMGAQTMAAKLSLGGTEANGRRGRNAVQGDGQESAAATIPIDNVKGSAGWRIGIGEEIKKRWEMAVPGRFVSRQEKKRGRNIEYSLNGHEKGRPFS